MFHFLHENQQGGFSFIYYTKKANGSKLSKKNNQGGSFIRYLRVHRKRKLNLVYILLLSVAAG